MYIEKLIERMNNHLQSLAAYSDPELAHTLEDAATALSTFQAENAQLRADLEYEREHADAYYEECGQWEAENEKLRAELEQVKRERDAAVSDLETIMAYNSDTCQFCKNGQCYVRGGTKSCLPKWRGQKEE